MKTLRAAGYCRTSSETQRDNTSIPEQKKRIENFIDCNGWTFTKFYVDACKSGSKLEGRDGFEQAMKDAAKDRFDILVPFDPTRYGRNGVDILNTLRTFKREYGKHVVDTKGSLDTRRTDVLGNYVHAGMAEQEKLNFLDRTKNGKLRRALEENRPLGPKRPFGRIWDKATKTWSIDKKQQALIAEVAARYLKGESLPVLARETGMNHANLCKVLRDRCGETWPQTIRCKELGIDETVQTKVPRLLPDKTIQEIRERLKANRTYRHKPPISKHGYLLSGHVFCAECGYTMFGQRNPNRRRYYRHAHAHRDRPCSLDPKPWVNADLIEDQILIELFNTLGNPVLLEKAIKTATPNCDELAKRRKKLEEEIERIERQRKTILGLIRKDAITATQAEADLLEVKDREATLNGQLDKLLANSYTEDVQQLFVEHGKDGDIFVHDGHSDQLYAGGNDLGTWLLMSRDEKRALVTTAFAKPLPDGKPPGVYVSPAGGARFGPKTFHYRIEGLVRVTSRAMSLQGRDLPGCRSRGRILRLDV
jgi:DNA invertase Pin-like site-specific DNA recombinase